MVVTHVVFSITIARSHIYCYSGKIYIALVTNLDHDFFSLSARIFVDEYIL